MTFNIETKLKISGDKTSAQAALRSTEEGLVQVEKQAKKAGDESKISGSATGTRYQAKSNGVIQTWGSSSTFLPGNASGSTASGGQYV